MDNNKEKFMADGKEPQLTVGGLQVGRMQSIEPKETVVFNPLPNQRVILNGFDLTEIVQISTKVKDKLNEMFNDELDDTLVKEVAMVHSYLEQSSVHSEIREDNLLMTVAFVVLSKLQYSKEGTYGRSWCKRGQQDVFFNLARKFDRLENIILNNAQDEVGESTVDTVGDEANYGMLWMTYYMRNDYSAFADWINKNLK